VSITLKATDPDAGDTVTFSVSKAANGGKISNFDNKDGTLTYTPPAGFSGQDAFNYQATDSHGAASNTATVTVTISKVNSAPTATDDTASTNADTPVVISVLNNDSDPDDNNSLTIDSIPTQPSSGTATINKNNGTITYTPNSGFTGTDTFEYSITDDNGGSDTAKVTVTVNAVNHSPVASNMQVTTDQDKPVSITLKATDSDEGDTLTFSVSKTANGGKISNFDNKDGTLTYTPPAGFSGQDAFNYQATDSHGAASNTATVTVTINKTNKPPIASAGSDATVNEGTRGYSLNGTGSTDSDGEITKYIWTQTAGPTVTLDTTSYPGYAVFDIPLVTGSKTKLTFELIVEDNDGARSQPDSVVISIKDLGPDSST
jgi:CshA-type fibril repeat protein